MTSYLSYMGVFRISIERSHLSSPEARGDATTCDGSHNMAEPSESKMRACGLGEEGHRPRLVHDNTLAVVFPCRCGRAAPWLCASTAEPYPQRL